MDEQQNESETWAPTEQLDFWDNQTLEEKLVEGAGPILKIIYMLIRGPGGPIFMAMVMICILLSTGKMTDTNFFGATALGIYGAFALHSNRGKQNGSP